MTYAVSSALQQAVYQTLSGDTGLAAIVGGNIFDVAPSGSVPAIYVLMGAERVRDRSDQTGYGASHDLTLTIVSSDAGFLNAKDAAAAVCDAILGQALTLVRGQLISINFLQASARRVGDGQQRQIELIFRARVADD